jgi:hypothetical protein
MGVLLILALALAIPSAWLQRIERMEQHFIAQSLGTRTAEAIRQQAQNWFQHQFILSGEYQASRDWARTIGEQLEWANTSWFLDRIETFWQTMAIATQRASLLAAAWPFMLGLVAGGLFDGLHLWKIRQLGFDYPSPKQRQYNQMGLMLTFSLLGALLLAPIPFHPILLVLLLPIATVSLAGSLAHRPKQI